MKAMILAAGRGERMRPLTNTTPKPLLTVGGKTLIEHHLERLENAGYTDIVINTHHLGEQIHQKLGNGEPYGVTIQYSDEQPKALETAGGIYQALPMLGDEPFLVINGDVWCDHPLMPPELPETVLAHLILVTNPEHNPNGDFALQGKHLTQNGPEKHTFSGIGWYRPKLFSGLQPGPQPLAPLLRDAMDREQINGELFQGQWIDVGTPERLEFLNKRLL